MKLLFFLSCLCYMFFKCWMVKTEIFRENQACDSTYCWIIIFFQHRKNLLTLCIAVVDQKDSPPKGTWGSSFSWCRGQKWKVLFLSRSETLLWCIFKAQNAPFLDVGGVLIFLCYLLGATATEAVMMIFFFLERGNLKSFFMAYKVCLALKTSLAFKLNHHQGQGIQLKPM